MTDNGKIVQTYVEYIPLSGVVMHITPVNAAVVKAIAAKGEVLLPYPDPAPYETPMENAVPGMMNPATDDPEYVALIREVDRQRNERLNRALVDYATTYPGFANRDELVSYFAARREQLRKIADLPDDDWEVTRDHIILSGTQDFATAVHLAVQSVELTGGEIADGIRIFRPALSGRTA